MAYTPPNAPPAEEPIDIAVLASGSGSNLQALIDENMPEVDIVRVVTDREGVGALDRASVAGIPTVVVKYSDHLDRDAFTEAVIQAVGDVDALILAGFMRILAPIAVRRFPMRILNVHPSLLPAFPGAHAVAQALAYGAKLTGVTVHFVDEEVDHGPIIAQRAVQILDGDTEQTLHERIQKEEHDLYPAVVRSFARGEIRVTGREVSL